MDSQKFHIQSYVNTNICGHARAHLGNVFNFSSADSEQQDILDWLTASLDPSASHDRACSRYQEGTLGWILDHAAFRDWCDRPSTSLQVFWCRGAMGTGKTTLVARILSRLQERGIPRGRLAVVYCEYSQRETLTVESVMGSILAQLCQQSQEGFSIPAYIKTAFQTRPRFWKRGPSLEQLKSWLHLRLKDQDTAFVLMDALDELSPRLRRKLLRSMQSMPQLKLLVTSREVPEPEADVFANQVIEIHAHEADLRNLMKSKFREEGTEAFKRLILGKPTRHKSFSTVEEQIISKITQLAQGMCVRYRPGFSHVML